MSEFLKARNLEKFALEISSGELALEVLLVGGYLPSGSVRIGMRVFKVLGLGVRRVSWNPKQPRFVSKVSYNAVYVFCETQRHGVFSEFFPARPL